MWLDASASHFQPPAGITADATQYGLFGGRLSADFPWGTAMLSGRFGSALAGSDGRWIQGAAEVATGGRIGRFGMRAATSAFGLRYQAPFRYDAGGLDLRPALSYPTGRLVLAVRPRLSLGAWSTETLRGDLRIAGADLEVRRLVGAWSVGLLAGGLAVENGVTEGSFLRVGGDLALDRGPWTAGVTLQAQRSPLETEVGGGVQVSWSVAPGVKLDAYGGRRVRDALFGTEGSLGISLTATVRAGRWTTRFAPPVAVVGEARPGGRVVQFAIRAPDADAVALTGDFSGWEPVRMEPAKDGWWRYSRVLPQGLYHFGFLVDDQWAIPTDAPGVVEDGWGRRNASIVVDL